MLCVDGADPGFRYAHAEGEADAGEFQDQFAFIFACDEFTADAGHVTADNFDLITDLDAEGTDCCFELIAGHAPQNIDFRFGDGDQLLIKFYKIDHIRSVEHADVVLFVDMGEHIAPDEGQFDVFDLAGVMARKMLKRQVGLDTLLGQAAGHGLVVGLAQAMARRLAGPASGTSDQ